MIRVFTARLQNGRIDTTTGGDISGYLKAKKDGCCTLTIATGVDSAPNQRTNRQNSYYWGVVIKIYLEAMIDTGDNTVEQVRTQLRLAKLADALHEMLKYEFAGCEVIDTDTGEIRMLPLSTVKMNTTEISIYWDKIRAACLDRYGVEIPPPPEDVFEKW